MTQSDLVPYLSVIIPAYNEAARIPHTLVAVCEYLARQSYTWELVIVLDGPTDNTLEIVQQFVNQNPHFGRHMQWIDRKENRGKGYSVRQGMLQARGHVRLFTDADNSTDITHFDKVYPHLTNGADIVICSRDSKDVADARQAVPQSLFKRTLGNLGNLFIQLVAVPGIWDTQCGFKAFTQDASEAIFAVAQIEHFAFDIEALALARYFDYKIEIVPAYWINDERSTVRLFNYIETLMDTLRIRWRLLTGSYARQSAVIADIDPAH